MAIGRFVSSVYTPGVRYIYTTGKNFFASYSKRNSGSDGTLNWYFLTD